MVIGTITKVYGFTFSEVSRFTLGQVVRFMRTLPEMMPLVNPYAKAPDKKLKGQEAIHAMKLLGVKDDRS
jgi:hypothetical protein